MCALTGLALGVILRSTAATMVITMTVLLVPPIAFSDDSRWQAIAGHATPYQAWGRPVETAYSPTEFPWTQTGAWTVYAVWALAAAAIAVTGLHRRDL